MDDDKALLLEHFRQRYAGQSQLPPFALSNEALQLWSSYHFPGNVRELRNIVIRLTAKYPGQIVQASALEAELDLQDEPASPEPPLSTKAGKETDAIFSAAKERLKQPEPFSLDRHLAETERNFIEAALQLAHGNVSQAARLLGINRTTLYNRMESFARGQ